MAWKLDARGESNLKTVKPELQRLTRKAIELSAKPFTIVQGNRSQAYQDQLYAQGRTKPGKIVTWTRNSKHIGGGAIDFAALDDKGAIDWNEKLYPAIAAAFQAASKETGIGITWGGEWKTKDWGHIQLEPSKDTKPIGAPQKPSEAPLEQKVNGSPQRDLHLPGPAMAFLQGLGWGRLQAAAIVANGMWESGGNAKNPPCIHTTALGDGGTAHGGWQWRGDRYIGKRGLLSFALTKMPGRSSADPEVQLRFVDFELKESEVRAGDMLLEAKSLEQATEAMLAYLRPAGFTWEKPSGGHGYEKRLKLAQGLF